MAAAAASASASSAARARARRRTRITARAALLLVIVLITGAFSITPLHAYLQQRAEIERLERQERIIEQANTGLEQRVGALHDPEELERLARECLGMVKPGETAFVTVPEGGGHPATNC